MTHFTAFFGLCNIHSAVSILRLIRNASCTVASSVEKCATEFSVIGSSVNNERSLKLCLQMNKIRVVEIGRQTLCVHSD